MAMTKFNPIEIENQEPLTFEEYLADMRDSAKYELKKRGYIPEDLIWEQKDNWTEEFEYGKFVPDEWREEMANVLEDEFYNETLDRFEVDQLEESRGRAYCDMIKELSHGYYNSIRVY